ncbi:MAG: hypothetical protein A3I79_06490 [Gemmatimonadetes bacterium RIFCSPLOWO2_02_FULL_71_11]|nr:MAG: hypothetical protein A3I79_06490 [Gemmatimonadetes bacterium RIFCSPLOWO2_02_FULL_71_11]
MERSASPARMRSEAALERSGRTTNHHTTGASAAVKIAASAIAPSGSPSLGSSHGSKSISAECMTKMTASSAANRSHRGCSGDGSGLGRTGAGARGRNCDREFQ